MKKIWVPEGLELRAYPTPRHEKAREAKKRREAKRVRYGASVDTAEMTSLRA